MKKMMKPLLTAASSIFLVAAGCSSSGNSAPNPSIGEYGLLVASANPTGGISIGVSPADVNGAGTTGSQTETTGLQLIYKAGTSVTLTAPSTASTAFVAWAGCDSTSGTTCTVTMNGQKSVLAEYTGVSSVAIVPATLTVARGGSVQIPVTVNGYGTCVETYPVPGSNPPVTMPKTLPCAGSDVTYGMPYLVTGATGANHGTVSSTGLYTPNPMDPDTSDYVVVTSDVPGPSCGSTGALCATVLINLQ